VQTIYTDQISQSEIIAQAQACLAGGGLVLFPTETTYGAGVDATNPQAIAKLLAYKSRREGKPLSIAVSDRAMAEQYVTLNESAWKIYQRFLPGPVTVVSHVIPGTVAAGVASEFDTLGVRIPDYELVVAIVRALGRPITATSANASGKKRPYTIQDVLDHLSAKQKSLIDLVIDAGPLPKNPPSTVIDTTLSTPVTLRQGQPQVGQTGATELTSRSEAETKKIAGTLLLKHWDQISQSGLVIALNGPLGAGKTIFAKGVAEFLQINDTITSPTYTYLEEYDFVRHGLAGQLHHLDLWKVDSQALFDRLAVDSLLKPGSVVVVEWWSNVVDFAQIKPNITITFNQSQDQDQVRLLLIEESQ
jgi:L-threonylcarbamoyladenylate synthase